MNYSARHLPLRSIIIFVLMLGMAGLVGCGNTGTSNTKPHFQHLDQIKQQTEQIETVGFDLDDTLLFSTPSFQQGFQSNVEPFSKAFWEIVNASDAEHSCVKPTVKKILEHHQDKGRSIYVITARSPHNIEPAQKNVSNRFNIPPDHLYFEPDSKVQRLRELGVDVYYGDSDSDIRDAQEAGAIGIRIQRNPKSSYDDKYNPGKFNEIIVPSTQNHDCS